MSDDLREKIEAIFHSYVPKEDKNMRLALAHTMLNGGTLELDFTNLMIEIAQFVETYADQRVCEALDRIEKASAHTQPSLHDVIESIRKELTNLTTKV